VTPPEPPPPRAGDGPLRPGCCPLGARNLEWFPASPPAGAWHPASFRWDAAIDVPVSEPVTACPFCGAALPARP